jgi:hypothetical protein
VKTIIFDGIKWSFDQSQKRGDFRLSPLLDRQARPPVNWMLCQIAGLNGLEFTMMGRSTGSELHLANTLTSLPIAFNVSHRLFSSTVRAAKFPAWGSVRESLFASHGPIYERLKTLDMIEMRRNNPRDAGKDVKIVQR